MTSEEINAVVFEDDGITYIDCENQEKKRV